MHCEMTAQQHPNFIVVVIAKQLVSYLAARCLPSDFMLYIPMFDTVLVSGLGMRGRRAEW